MFDKGNGGKGIYRHSKGITLSGTFLREQRFTIDKKICRRAIAIDQNHGKRMAEPLNVMESNQSIEGVESVTGVGK